MIVDYNGYEKAVQGRTDADITALAELSELSPTSYKRYGEEYQKRHSGQRQAQKQGRNGNKMFMTFSEYEKSLDTAGSTSLMGGDSNLRKISAFAKEYPAQYADYRERMRNKQQEQHKARRF